jgi:hypothetical protein
VGAILVVALFTHSSGRTAVATAPPAATVAGPAKQVRARDELKTAVMGKTMEEVKALLGAPFMASELAGQPVWKYERITRDPASGNEDRFVDLHFADGRVTKVVF